MKRLLTCCLLSCVLATASAQQSGGWPNAKSEAKAGVRWWWLGSAVDKDNLEWNLKQYANHGIGAVEITPLYGVQGNQANNIPYLSDRWMEMLRYTQQQCKDNGIELDMATGTGWPFGGPWVPLEESACKVIFVDTTFVGKQVKDLVLTVAPRDVKNSRLDKVMAYHGSQAIDVTASMTGNKLTWKAPKGTKKHDEWRVIATYIRYGVMKVKRAAPGGEGLVIDHFDRKAVANYLHHIEAAFERTKTPYPHTFFNDSYEVAEATWTPTLFQEFEKRRGYRLQDHLPQLIAADVQVVADYRETLGDLLLENFTRQWTAWAHSHGAITRNQAHGSPANLIDCYAAVDIPEIEGFGLSDFGIKGLRTDPGKTRKNDSDYSMFKYAPSAAHVCGKPFTSSETFTWLTEHFRTSLSQLKPDLDLMFCAGVNHMFFHGTCYSPKDDPWPGWKFYASIDMSPTNSIWRDAPFFMKYVERCQSFLQKGQPDNDFLVYLPVRDMWRKNPQKLLMQFSIHAMGQLAPEFIQSILAIDRAGFDCDYISDRLLAGVKIEGGQLVTTGGTRYKAVIIPTGTTVTPDLKAQLERLAPYVIMGEDAAAMARFAKPEAMKTQLGLKAIRRHDSDGWHYFMANLTPNDIDQQVALAVPCKAATWYDPMTGDVYPATIRDGKVAINLRSGESRILQTRERSENSENSESSEYSEHSESSESSKPLAGPWTLSFTEETPQVARTFQLDRLQTWETLSPETAVTMGTGIYTTTVTLTKQEAAHGWRIDLGDVRESARVYINGTFIGCAWAVPFVIDCRKALKAGPNEVRIEVTNLPANRIADLDRKGVKWRKMEEINVVDINYKKTTYDSWEPMKSGLNSQVKLVMYD